MYSKFSILMGSIILSLVITAAILAIMCAWLPSIACSVLCLAVKYSTKDIG